MNDVSGHLTESSLRCLFTGTFEIQAALRTGRRPDGTACAFALHVRPPTTTGPSSFDCLLLSLRLLVAFLYRPPVRRRTAHGAGSRGTRRATLVNAHEAGSIRTARRRLECASFVAASID
ncbi:hypothetical protein GSH05_18285 [Burkholderia pseudomallei]|nr:hypothetical protein [Burkholderia pseudomallei]MBM5653543.1 hypothetical protein [Burkholderia pseudomallei]